MKGEPKAVKLATTHTHPRPLPGTETVRQAALAASWRRDRAVARRRLARRWVVWYLWRSMPYLLAAGALLGVSVYLWRASATPSGPHQASLMTEPAQAPRPAVAPFKLHSENAAQPGALTP